MSSSPFTVTSTADGTAADTGTLRWAVAQANLAPGSTINFDIAQADINNPVPQVIQLSAALDSFAGTVTIDATGEPGYAGTPMVQLLAPMGDSMSTGLDLGGANSVVKGLSVGGFGAAGIHVEAGADNTTLQSDYLGVASDGTTAVPNGFGLVVDANNAQITGDLISGNSSDGIDFNSAAGGTVTNNKIGTDASGEYAVANQGAGIHLYASSGVVIGGSSAAMNVIAGNMGSGIFLDGVFVNNVTVGSTNCTIDSNFIGTDLLGQKAVDANGALLGNAGAGIEIDSNSNANTISGNVIAGSGGNDINVMGSNANTIAGNYIGTNAAGTAALLNANNGDGIVINLGSTGTSITGNLISGHSGVGINLGDQSIVEANLIGTDYTGAHAIPNAAAGVYVTGGGSTITGNTIAFNVGAGVAVYSGASNAIEQNSIFSNSPVSGDSYQVGLGIDLSGDGITPNTPAQNKSGGPNLLQDFPVLDQSVTRTATQLTITGTVDGPASTMMTLDFYTDAVTNAVAGGQGTMYQGQIWLGSSTVTTDSTGNASFTAIFDTTSAQWAAATAVSQTAITATATDIAGNTSEFSAAALLPAAPVVAPPTMTATTTSVSSSDGSSDPTELVTFTATVAPSPSGSTGVPTGTVLFFVDDSATPADTETLNAGGQASFSISTLALGSHTIKASYQGDANYSVSDSGDVPQTVAQDATKTVMATAANPSVYGQAGAITATVSPVDPSDPTPTGTVTLMDNGSQVGPAVALDATGAASWPLSMFSPGPHSFSVVYNGSTEFVGSSGALSQQVNQAATTMTLASSQDSSTYGASVKFTATLSVVAPGVATPSGVVTFSDGGTLLGTGTISGGVATFTTSSLVTGPHNITASYGGDIYCTGSSAATTQTVTAAMATATVASNLNPSSYGQLVTFTATVSSAAGTPSGSVSLYDGTNQVGAAASLVNGQATWQTDAFGVGDHQLTVVYGGGSNFLANTSAAYHQVVAQAGTATTVTSLLPTTVYGQSVTFTASVVVTNNGSGKPDGTVLFYDNGNLMGQGTLDGNDLATFTTSTLAQGNHSITATYVGTTNFLPSTSPAINEAVGFDNSETALNSSADPSVYGQAVTITATVMDVQLTSYTPTGSVAFYDGQTPLGTATLDSNGVASLPLSGLSVGPHSITAVYSGDKDVAGGPSAALSQTVNRAASAASVASSVNPSVFGQSVTLTAAVSSTAGMPTGSVIFLDGSTQLGTGTLDSTGHATLSTSGLSVGNHSLSVSYTGDTSFQIASSPAISQSVGQASTQTGISASTLALAPGQSVTFTANVSVMAPGAASPSGMVTFLDNGVSIGQGAVNNGVAVLTTSSLAVGSHNITASYAGDTDCKASVSGTVSPTVTAPLATFSGHVFNDVTGNGLTADDTPMGAVVVKLYRDSNGDGMVDNGDILVGSVNTASDGSYIFGGEQPGKYLVEEIVPNGYVRTAPLVNSAYAINAAYGTVSTHNDFDNFQKCNCASDLSRLYFTDGCHTVTDLRGQTHEGDTVNVTFTVKAGTSDTFSLVVYSAPGATFDANTASQQRVLQVASGSFTTGTHTLTVHLPRNSHYQVDFICGSVITQFGPAGSNIFYTPQGRLISADNE